jgi:hypothetical protein
MMPLARRTTARSSAAAMLAGRILADQFTDGGAIGTDAIGNRAS